MHYYQFNIGDYAKATRHLSNLEDLAYRRLMEIYYDTEKPLVNDVDKLARLINMRENKEEIEVVLSDFFSLTDEGFYQKRIDEEIQHYNAKADTARVNGKKGGRPKKANGNPEETEQEPRKTQSVILANPEETGSKANQEPITNNHKPITINQLDKSNLPAKAGSAASDIQDAFNCWVQVMEKNTSTKLNKKREAAVRARLKEGYTIDQIKQAIIGCSKTPHNMGVNDQGKPWNDIELICRNGNNVERFMDNAHNPPAAPDQQFSKVTAGNIAMLEQFNPEDY